MQTRTLLIATALVASTVIVAPVAVVQAVPSISPRTSGDGVLGSWSAMGTGTAARTNVMTIRDDTLYAGGDFTSAGGVPGTAYIAAWSIADESWHALGNGMQSTVWALATVDDTVFAGGVFTSASGVAGTAKLAAWSNADDTWHPAAGTTPTYSVIALALRGDDTLSVGEEIGAPVRMRQLDLSSQTWTFTPAPDFNQRVEAIAAQGSLTPSTSDDTVYVGGPFTAPGNNVAALRPDGGGWAALGAGLNSEVRSLALRGQGTPTLADDTLYAGGFFTDKIAAWDGTSWSALGSGLDDVAFSLAIDETRNLVYAGGRFTKENGGATNGLRRVAVWDAGISEWIPLQFGAAYTDNGVTTGEVEALALDDSVLYVGGNLDPSIPNAAYIRRWTWDPPSGTTSDDTALPGDTITLTGDGLIGVTSVRFGDDTQATYTRDDSTTLTVTVPAGDYRDDTIYVDAVGGIGEFGPFTSWPTVPEPPVVPTADAGDASAQVEWDAPPSDGGSSVTGYSVSASPGGATCSTATTSCTVGGLSNGTSYTFSVRAINAKGESDASADSNAVTPEAMTPPTPQAPGSPTGVRASAGNASATVSWTAPAASGSFAISTYRVQSSPGGTTCLTSTTSCTVAGLRNGTEYSFTVQALSGAGWGAASDPSNVVTPQAPSTRTITITGSREGRRVVVTGTSVGLAAGVKLTPWFRIGKSTEFRQGRVQVTVREDGSFTWQRRSRNAVSIYVEIDDVRSNVVRIR